MIERDNTLEDLLAGAITASESRRPRNLQTEIGPSSLGACREFIRATIEGDPGIPERPRGLDAAFFGTISGDAIEQILVAELTAEGATTQSRYEIDLAPYGLQLRVAGSGDATLVHRNEIIDLKSKDAGGMDKVAKEGPTLDNLIQVSTYVVAAVQMGVLQQGARGVLAYFNRAGEAGGGFVCVPIEWEACLRFVELAVLRLKDVLDVIDAGSPEESRWSLRDQSPSMCFWFQCPFRQNCWRGSEWQPTGAIDGADEIALVAEYVAVRANEKATVARKAAAKEALRALAAGGVTPDGWIVSWKGNRLDVVPA